MPQPAKPQRLFRAGITVDAHFEKYMSSFLLYPSSFTRETDVEFKPRRNFGIATPSNLEALVMSKY